MATLRDLMNLPDAIHNELEYRSTLKAEALAHKIVNKVTGSSMTPNPYVHNPFHSSQDGASRGQLTQHVNEILGGKNE